jgi:N-acyl amino acid synthase of PEP-CTERM/exosortase system
MLKRRGGIMELMLEQLLGRHDRDLLVPSFKFEHVPLPDPQTEVAVLKEIFALRYQVYCQECGFLDADDYPDNLETDEYESRSAHVAAHTHDGQLIGAVRLVQATPYERLPFEDHCTAFEHFQFPPREQCGEISRLVVRKDFRRRPGDSLIGMSKDFAEKGRLSTIAPHPLAAHGKERRSDSPQILLGMYRELYRHSRQHGIRYWFAAMERSLARSLSRMGFHFHPVGPLTDYYGPVTPYMADLHEMETRLKKDNPFLAAWFHDESISPWLIFRTWVQMKLNGKKH